MIGNEQRAASELPPASGPSGSVRGMVDVTWPLVTRTLRTHLGALIALGILGVVLGVIPTVKSELEAAVLDQISRGLAVSGPSAGPSLPSTDTLRQSIERALDRPLDRFSGGVGAEDDSRGVPEKLARLVFSKLRLLPALGIYAVLALATFGLVLLSRVLQARVGKAVFASLRSDGLRAGLYTDPSDVPALTSAANPAGQYAMAIHQGAATVSDTYKYILEAGQHVFAIVTVLLLLRTKHPAIAGVAIVFVMAQVGISVLQARRLRERRKELDIKRNALVARTDDVLAKRDLIVAFEKPERYVDKLRQDSTTYAEVDRHLDVAEAKYQGVGYLVGDASRVLVLVLAVWLAYQLGAEVIGGIGDAYFLLSIYTRLNAPVESLLRHYDNIRRSESTARTFLDILDRGSSRKPRRQDSTAPHSWQPKSPIEFRDVWFRYPTVASPVLRGATFVVPPGKTTLLVGPSGCGKTTIARILLGFWRPDPDQGDIRIGGHGIHDFDPVELRAHMSYVAQGDHIVDETVRENLRWAEQQVPLSDDRMRAALEDVGIAVATYPDVLEAPARVLSGGQQQRLSVARMMLDESEILIMDEPLGGTDVFTLRDLVPELRKVIKERGHTVLLISHRLAFAAFADHVVVMNGEGVVVEEGAPRELLGRASIFAELYAASISEYDWNRRDAVAAGPAGPDDAAACR